METLKTICRIFSVLSLFLTLGHGKQSGDHDHCCSGSVTLGATGAAAAKWAQYLGQYKPTKQKNEGAPVYQNQKVKYLYHLKKGQWTAINGHNQELEPHSSNAKFGMRKMAGQI